MQLGIGPPTRHEDVASIMDEQDHHSCSDLVGHHGEKDEGGGHRVVQQPLVELPLLPPPEHQQLHHREQVHA